MTQLQEAMANVDEQERLHREDAVGGAGAAFVTDRPEPPRRPHAKLLENMDRALRDAGAFSDAHWIVNRAISRAQRDVADPGLADSEAIQNIYVILRNVQGTAS